MAHCTTGSLIGHGGIPPIVETRLDSGVLGPRASDRPGRPNMPLENHGLRPLIMFSFLSNGTPNRWSQSYFPSFSLVLTFRRWSRTPTTALPCHSFRTAQTV